jgi:ubiquitin-protein ligase
MSLNNNNSEVFISKETIRRIINDIKTIKKNPLHEHGIYYEHDETDLLKGKALIIGPSDTPYEHGFYFFKFTFPSNYPYSPPMVEYCTNDGITRFNPNLYKNGKVCLSVLNTWQGDQWSGCQSLSSILLSICTVFVNNPLTNEPGIYISHDEVELYNEIIRYKNIQISILSMLEKAKSGDFDFYLFNDIIEKHFKKVKTQIISNINDNYKNKNHDNSVISMKLYNMNIKIDYNSLLTILTSNSS